MTMKPRLPARDLLRRAELAFHHRDHEVCAMAARAAIEASLRQHLPEHLRSNSEIYGAVGTAGRLRREGVITRAQASRIESAVAPGNHAAHGKAVDRKAAASVLVAARSIVTGNIDFPEYEERVLAAQPIPTIGEVLRARWRQCILAIA